MKNISNGGLIILIVLLFTSCRKNFLAAKPDDALVVPSTLMDLQALLDNDMYMNGTSQSGGGPNPGLLVGGTDEYFMSDQVYNTATPFTKGVYIWARNNPYAGVNPMVDWSSPYRAIFYSNIVLEQLAKIPYNTANDEDWDNVKGSALFFRAHTFYQLAQVFAPAYEKATASTLKGIPLRLKADVNEPINRSSLDETYQRIISDLNTAAGLLPDTPDFKTRPSLPAVYALLARVHLSMRNYTKAGMYADSCLKIYNSLLDYNTLNQSSNSPFPAYNIEVIYHSLLQNNQNQFTSTINSRVDTLLYSSYHPDDLRRVLFFRLREPGRFSFKGSYSGMSLLFSGIAVDEVYLIRAEAAARRGHITEAMKDLNTLLATRWKTGKFVPYTAANGDEALEIIVNERRKQLLLRGLRWSDLRRLNVEPKFAKTIYRMVNGEVHELPPGDWRYTWPIPESVLAFNPQMDQNPR